MSLLRSAPRLVRGSLAFFKQPALQRTPAVQARQSLSSSSIITSSFHSTALRLEVAEAQLSSPDTETVKLKPKGPHQNPKKSKPPRKPRSGAAKIAAASLHKVWVGNMPKSMHAEHLSHEFARYGIVVRAKVVEAPDPKSNFGFVKFATEEAAQKAIAEGNGHSHQDHVLKVQAIDPKLQTQHPVGKRKRTSQLSARNLFVSGLGRRTTEEEILTMFGEFGEVEKVTQPTRKRRTLPNGSTYAFVSYHDDESAAAAIKALHMKAEAAQGTGVSYGLIKVKYVHNPGRWPLSPTSAADSASDDASKSSESVAAPS